MNDTEGKGEDLQSDSLPSHRQRIHAPRRTGVHAHTGSSTAVLCTSPHRDGSCPVLSGAYLLRQLVLVLGRALLQLCDARLLLLHHRAQVLNAVVVWQLIFGHLQAAAQGGRKAEQDHSMGHEGEGRKLPKGLSSSPYFEYLGPPLLYSLHFLLPSSPHPCPYSFALYFLRASFPF